MSAIPKFLLAAAASALLLAACGGSDTPADTGTTPPPATGTPAPLAQFGAVGSSARTATLHWTPPASATTVAIERQTDGGSYTELAQVDGRSGQFLDDGLAAGRLYRYRVVATDTARTLLAEGQATTTDEEPMTSPRGAAQGDASVVPVGTAGGRLQAGAVAMDVPAGALPAGSSATLQRVANTAPDGRGDGLLLQLSAAPSRPLALTLQVDEAELADIDGLRVAVQRADGTWFSLPADRIDRAARTLQATLPPQLVAASTAGATAGLQAAAASVSIDFTIVKYLAFSLKPKAAEVAVNGTLPLVPYARVRGYEVEIGTCERFDSGVEACIYMPMLETRQVPLLNSKPGYTRSWSVFLDEGGNATDGTVVPNTGSAGAVYTAPAVVPEPDTVWVNFESTHDASGRKLLLSSSVKITDDRWVGTMTAEDGPSIAGTTLLVTADVTWRLDRAATVGSRKVYRPEGQLSLQLTDDNCWVSATPATAPVSGDTRLVELVVDESTSPATYSARLITFWTTEILAVCPKASDQRTTEMAGYGWDVSGVVGGSGRIEGQTVVETARLAWSFSR